MPVPFSSIGSPTLHAAVRVITVHLSETLALFDNELQPLWLLLLFRHSTKSLNAHEERMATSPELVTRLYLPHAIVVRLHVHTGNGGRSRCLSSSLSLSVGLSIQDKAMDVARSAPQGSHYHADVIYLLP